MSTTATTPASGAPTPLAAGADEPWRWRWIALFVILAAEVMDLLDALVTTIAAPSIRRDLGGSDTLVQWLGAGYTLAMAIGLITGGRLGDIYGRRRMFVVGAAGFTLGSLLCAVATTPELLIGARVGQGLFGALMLPQGLGLIREMFSEKEQAAAFGAFGPVMGLSSVGGPVLAGWLVSADYWGSGWRMIFLINLPLGLLALAGALRFLPETRSLRPPRLDVGSAVLGSLGGFLLVYPLVQGRELGWPAWTFASLAAAAAVFGVFARRQVRRRAAGLDPLVEPDLFRKRQFTAGLLTGMLFFAALIGFSLVFTLYVQLGLGWSPLHAGLAGLPQSIGVVVGFGIAGPLAARLGRGLMLAGAVLVAGGSAVVAVTVQAVSDVSAWTLVPGLALLGIGLGLFMAPFFDIVLAAVEPHESGSASGTISSIQQLGSAFGVAVLGTVFFQVVDDRAAQGAVSAFTDAASAGMWGAVALVVLAFATTFLLPRRARPEGGMHGAPAAAPAGEPVAA